MAIKKRTEKEKRVIIMAVLVVLLVLVVVLFMFASNAKPETITNAVPQVDAGYDPDTDDFDKIQNGIHLRTGFIDAPGLTETVNNCTSCHSAKLVTQNRMSKEGWVATIKWMQETQNLWDLGDQEEKIVSYLATNYAPEKLGRRKNLEDPAWYVLD